MTSSPKRTEWWKDPAWAAVILSVLSLVAAAVSGWASFWSVVESKRQHEENVAIAAQLRNEDLAREAEREEKAKAVLVATKPRYEPEGVEVPTVVALFNQGKQEAVIERVTLRLTAEKGTPNRETLFGQGPTIAVNFTDKHYDKDTKTFSLTLRSPSSAPAEQWTAVEVAIVQPAWMGKTYTGVLTVYYDGAKSVQVSDVEVDVLKAIPQRR